MFQNLVMTQANLEKELKTQLDQISTAEPGPLPAKAEKLSRNQSSFLKKQRDSVSQSVSSLQESDQSSHKKRKTKSKESKFVELHRV